MARGGTRGSAVVDCCGEPDAARKGSESESEEFGKHDWELRFDFCVRERLVH